MMVIFYAALSVLDQSTWLSKAIIKRGFTFLAEKFLRPPQVNTSASAERCLLTSYRCRPLKVEDNFAVTDCLSKKEQKHQY